VGAPVFDAWSSGFVAGACVRLDGIEVDDQLGTLVCVQPRSIREGASCLVTSSTRASATT
jgi:hypothetical protein